MTRKKMTCPRCKGTTQQALSVVHGSPHLEVLTCGKCGYVGHPSGQESKAKK